MRAIIRLFLTILIGGLFACNSTENQPKLNLFDFIPPQTSYVVKVNNKEVVKQKNPLILDAYLSASDKAFLAKANLQIPFNINILQNNSKIKGFVAVGKLADIDTIFNGTQIQYDNHTIYSEKFQKKDYYATQINGMDFISNQKLFIENCIRDRDDLAKLAQDSQFDTGMKSFDANADLNVVVLLNQLNPDSFYQSGFKVNLKDIGTWQFFDLVAADKPIASGVSLAKDSTSILVGFFKNIAPENENFARFIPFASGEMISLTFDDFSKFISQLKYFKTYAPKYNSESHPVLESLKAIAYFEENSNKAYALKMTNLDDFTGENPDKIAEINNFEIYTFSHENLLNDYFNNLFPSVKARFYTLVDDYIIVTESKSYLEKVINDIQNHSCLADSKTYQDLKAEIPDDYHLVLFKNKLSLNGRKYMKAQTYNVESETVFTNMVLKSFKPDKNAILIEQILSYPFKEIPNTKPQLVFNHKTKQYNIIYQDEENRLNLLNFKGKKLWKVPVKDKIIGKIHQVDLLRNRKLQYTFVTPHYWYVIDRLGRKVEKFPEHFTQKITQGLSVFDYDRNRKYRFGITQGKKFRLFDNQARKVKGFKVKTKTDIQYPPQHFRIGSKDFIVMQDEDGKLYLLNRRGAERIKVNKKFQSKRNRWGVYNQKFVNIDDNDNLVSIDLSGKVKSAKMDLGEEILSTIKYKTLSAIADNKLLINKKVNTLDLGVYARPQVYKTTRGTYVFVADQDNNKIYAFNREGNLLDKFPIIGQEVLDFKADKNGKYLLVYDSAQNLIVYKF